MDTETMWEMAKPIVAGQIRTGMATLGGMLVADGAISNADEGAFIRIASGAALWAIPAAWSWWQKVGEIKVKAFLAKQPPLVGPHASVGTAVQAADAAAAAEPKT